MKNYSQNIFIFGLKVNEVQQLKLKGYRPEDYYKSNEKLKNIEEEYDDEEEIKEMSKHVTHSAKKSIKRMHYLGSSA